MTPDNVKTGTGQIKRAVQTVIDSTEQIRSLQAALAETVAARDRAIVTLWKQGITGPVLAELADVKAQRIQAIIDHAGEASPDRRQDRLLSEQAAQIAAKRREDATERLGQLTVDLVERHLKRRKPRRP